MAENLQSFLAAARNSIRADGKDCRVVEPESIRQQARDDARSMLANIDREPINSPELNEYACSRA
jgi:hypothetical protein